MNMRSAITTLVLATVATGGVAFAGDDLTSLSYISYLERYATVRPGQGGETLDAVVNMPVLAGDRLDTARGARVELQLSDGSSVWVDEFTTLDFDALAYSRESSAQRTALYLSDEGSIAVEIPPTALGSGSLRVDSRRGTIFLNRPGLYRLKGGSGELSVEVHQGLAELPEGYGSTLLRTGQTASLDEDGDTEKNELSDDVDDFWSWVEERRHPSSGGRTAQYVDAGHGGRAAVLDSYGDWVYVDSYSTYMWRPRVAMGWTPYSSGRWVWTPVGWTWIAYEPWGWYPYHYGSWYWDASVGWAWNWDRVWGPAWVHWLYWDGYVGWCPRGYYDYSYWNRHGGDWNHDGHGGAGRPGRWSDTTFDFHGRVRLRDVDSRPWTFVASDRFTDSHLERVRVDPSRLLRDLPADRYGEVRSGPLLTPGPDRSAPSRTIDNVFRREAGGRELPEVSDIFRRQVGGSDDTGERQFRPVRTGDVDRDSRPVGSDGGTLRTIEPRVGRGRDGAGIPDRTTIRDSLVRRDPRSSNDRSGGEVVTRRSGDPIAPSSTRDLPPTTSRTPSRVVSPPTRSNPGTTREVTPPSRKDSNTGREIRRSLPPPPASTPNTPRTSYRSKTQERYFPGETRSWSSRREAAASRRFDGVSRVESRTVTREVRSWTPSGSRGGSTSSSAPRVSSGSYSRPSVSSPSHSSSSSARSSGSGSSRSSGSGSARSTGGSRRHN